MKKLGSIIKIYSAVLIITYSNFIYSANNMAVSDSQTKSDSAIISSMIILNKNEINAAQIAEKKSSNAAVKRFSKWMKNDHSHNLNEAKNLAKNLHLSLVSGDISQKLEYDGKNEANKLTSAKPGHSFDIDYMRSMVKDHQQALGLINKFIAESTDSSLKKYLETTRIHVNEHLKKAESILSSI